MSRTRGFFRQGDCPYFVTNAIIDWLPIFEDTAYCDIIVDSLKHLRKQKRIQVNDYVLMPTQMHAILWPESGSMIPAVMRDFKRYTSRAISDRLERDGKVQFLERFAKARFKGKGNTRYKIWQDGYHPEMIFREAFCRQKMEYIHNNPLKAGLVSDPVDWKYSGARNYLLGDQSVIELDLLEL